MFTKSVSADRGLVGQPRMFGARGDWTSRRTLGGLAQASVVTQAVNALTSAGRKGVIPGSAANRSWWRDRNRTQPWDSAVDLERTVEFADDLTGNPVGWQLGANLCTDPGCNRPADWTLDVANGSGSVSGGVISISSTSGGYVTAINSASVAAVPGRSYRVTCDIISVTGNGVRLDIGGTNGPIRTTPGKYSADYVAVNTEQVRVTRGSGGAASSAIVDNIRVQEVINDTSWMGAELLQSRTTLASPWTLSGSGTCTITTGIADPFGGTQAVRLVFSGANLFYLQSLAAQLQGRPINFAGWIKGTSGESLSINTAGRDDQWFLNGSWQRFDFSWANVTGQPAIGFSTWVGNARTIEVYLPSAREIPGHPIVSAVSGSGLVGSRRVNLLQRTTFTGATSGTPGTAPTGWIAGSSLGTQAVGTADAGGNLPITFTADRLWYYQTVACLAFVTYDCTIEVLGVSGGATAIENVVTTSVMPSGASLQYIRNGSVVSGTTVVSAGDRVGMRITIGATAGNVLPRIGNGTTTSISGSVTLWKPEFRPTFWNSFNPPPYQRVNDGTAGVFDYDDAGFPLHLKNVTGTQAMMTLGTVNMTAGDAGVMLANVVKLSDAATAVIAETSTDSAAFNGAIGVLGPGNAGANRYRTDARGTVAASIGAGTASQFNAPHVAALIAQSDISAPVLNLSINGSALTPNTATQGTGNLGNHRLNIAGRDVGGTASLRFTGYYIGNFPALVAGDAGIDTLALSRELAAQGGYTY